jgi:hypothetical protein
MPRRRTPHAEVVATYRQGHQAIAATWERVLRRLAAFDDAKRPTAAMPADLAADLAVQARLDEERYALAQVGVLGHSWGLRVMRPAQLALPAPPKEAAP